MNVHNFFFIVSLSIFSRPSLVVTGHGRMTDPPSRASAWRFGFNTPINYNDNEGNCGGFTHQWRDNKGRCGACGDSWSIKPRPHEAGGAFATGTIVRNYTAEQTIVVTVEVTANHKGFMEFRICPVDDDVEDQGIHECLNRNLITLAQKNKTRHHVALREGYHHIALVLPKNITCRRCVLQWRYVAGNNWGICPGGFGAQGCGPQEEFRACADIAILPRGYSKITNQDGQKSEVINNNTAIAFTLPDGFFTTTNLFYLLNVTTKPITADKPSTTTTTTQRSTDSKATLSNKKLPLLTTSATVSVVASTSTLIRRLTTSAAVPKENFGKHCKANGLWRFVPGIKEWCNANCNYLMPYCPSTHCICS